MYLTFGGVAIVDTAIDGQARDQPRSERTANRPRVWRDARAIPAWPAYFLALRRTEARYFSAASHAARRPPWEMSPKKAVTRGRYPLAVLR